LLPCSPLAPWRRLPADFPDVPRQRIEPVILSDPGPASPLPGASQATATLLLCSLIVITAADWRLGIAGWLARKQPAGVSGLQPSGSTSAGRARECAGPTDDARVKAARFSVVRPDGAAACPPGGRHFAVRLPLEPQFLPLALSCWEIGVMCAAVSAPLFWLSLRTGLSLDPVTHGATAGLFGGLVGVTVLEIYCPYLDRLHIQRRTWESQSHRPSWAQRGAVSGRDSGTRSVALPGSEWLRR
jgi:hypothetical protein